MKATNKTVINGKIYNVGDELPDYGSLVFDEVRDNTVSIKGNKTDFNKLPTYVNPGSTAYFWDTSEVYMFDGNTWLQQ